MKFKTCKLLKIHAKKIKKIHLKKFFKSKNELIDKRFNDFVLKHNDIIIDISKNHINKETIQLLIKLANEANLKQKYKSMFKGDFVNKTENRAALHTSFRNQDKSTQFYNKNKSEFKKMSVLTKKIRKNKWKGYTGKFIRNIIHIGIGGSYLGIKMIVNALKHLTSFNIKIYFISNIDGTVLSKILKKIKLEETLIIIVSKTFYTSETITNSITLKKLLIKEGCKKELLDKHFIAISSNIQSAIKFGIKKKNILKIRNWIGGRYSIWSSSSLIIMITIGIKNFKNLLSGANEIDKHFYETPFEKNIPIIMGLLSIWYRNFLKLNNHLIIPYSESLKFFPKFLQQLEMESNGKQTDLNNNIIKYKTSPIIWDGIGTNSQHSFFQMIHQGKEIIPIDFIAITNPEHSFLFHHIKLLSNCFAQSRALMIGKTKKEISKKNNKNLINHIIFKGNRPSTTIVLNSLTANSLGSLIAIYEHKIFVESVIWNINPFDQWGVELGKEISYEIESNIINNNKINEKYDSSTLNLIRNVKKRLFIKKKHM